MLCLILIGIFALRFRLLAVPLERDEGEYAYAGQLLLKGIPPFTLAYNMKMPGIYAAYAAIMAACGQTVTGIHLGLAVVNMISTVLLFLLARRLFDNATALVSAACFAMLAAGESVLGAFAHATHFVVLFALAGFAALAYRWNRLSLASAFLSGLLFGVAFTMKQHAAAFILFAGVLVLWQSIRVSSSGFRAAATVTLFSAGVFLPFLFIVIVMIAAGTFSEFWFWTFDYARAYVSTKTLGDGLALFVRQLRKITSDAELIWLLAVPGLLAPLWNAIVRRRAALLLGAAVTSIAAIAPGLYFREHYFILVLPIAALLAAVGLTASVRRLLASKHARTQSRSIAAASVALVLVSLVSQWDYFVSLHPMAISRKTYGFNPFVESVEIGKRLAERSTPDDRIAVLGSEPQIYFYARRLSATGYVYMYPLLENQPYSLEMQTRMIREIETAEPRFVVLFTGHTSWAEIKWKPDDPSVLRIFDWIDRYCREKYSLIGMIEPVAEGGYVAMWNDEARRYKPKSAMFIAVFERKIAPHAA